MNTELYRITTAMSKLDCSRATIYRMIARGELDVVKISLGATRITGASLGRIVAAGHQEIGKITPLSGLYDAHIFCS